MGLDFGALLETRVKEHKSNSLSTVFKGWSMEANYAFNRQGRIWVVWSPKLQLRVVQRSSQMITCVVIKASGFELLCSFVYASNFDDERKELWKDICSLQDSTTYRGMPWMCCGDFNETLHLSDHSNSANHPFITSGMRDFQEVLRHCSFFDMAGHGPHFTWSNKRDNGLICKKLDRLLINLVWLQHHPDSYSVFESGGCSDHLRCRFTLGSQNTKQQTPFKFSNALTTLPEFLPIVESFWSNNGPLFHSTSALFFFTKKLKHLKPLIRKLGRTKLHDLTRRVDVAFQSLCAAQTRTLSNADPQDAIEESSAYDRWDLLSGLEEKFLRKKSKLHWLQVGDRNNKFFHNAIKLRRANNGIKEVINSEGTRLTLQLDIQAEAIKVFSGLLNAPQEGYQGCSGELIGELIDFRCSTSQRDILTLEVQESEIRQVLLSLPLNKSPGPDGYSVEFFKAAWPLIGKDMTVAIQSFFIYGFLPKGLNTTILALIPKKTDAKFLQDYRPISCCNVVYKIISKILANRLKSILPEFIDPNQSAFIKDRLLLENLLLASELVKDYHKDSISPRCALKIDIAKAFDSVQWDFILTIFTSLNFPAKFITWIKLCISTASFSVQINGQLSGFFRSSRGLRQGCSLSPYIFVMCMNVLSKMLNRAAAAGSFGYHPRCRNLKLTHLCFADDIMVFTDGTFRSLEAILGIFSTFNNMSGLNISPQKSQIFSAGLTSQTLEKIRSDFPFTSGHLPVRYLGLPLMPKRMTLDDCLPLLEKIKCKIGSWTCRYLSFAGRLQLLSSVIAGLTTFWLSAFRLPSSCIREIERLCSAFLWSGPDLNPRKAKLSWKEVCKPKKEGGLGLRSLHDMNKVSCFKLIWNLVSGKDCLWVNWIHRSLIRKGSFWSVKASTSLGSWMWKKLLKYRDAAKEFHHMEVKSGKHTSFWYDRWCELGRLHDQLGGRGFIDLGIKEDATIADALNSHRRRLHRQEFLNQIEDKLESLRDSSQRLRLYHDQSLWRCFDGNFKSRFNSHDMLKQLRPTHQEVYWHKGVWFSNATPKYSFLTWLSAHNRLTTGDRMSLWAANIDKKCRFCPCDIESRNHLFFSCTYTSHVWHQLTIGILGPLYTTTYDDILTIMASSRLPSPHRFLLRYVFQVSIHTLWLERNKRRHGEAPVTQAMLIKRIDQIVRNRLSTILPSSRDGRTLSLQVWFGTRV